MVMLGLEEKLQALPLESLGEQVALVVSAIGRGMPAETADARQATVRPIEHHRRL
jgi:hypothetical protein